MRNDTAWHAVVELAASRHGTFHASEAATAGIEQRRLRRAVEQGQLLRPHPRVYLLRSAPPTQRQQLHVATLATRQDHRDGTSTGGVLSHGSAAALHGLIPEHPPTPSIWLPSKAKTSVSGIDIRRSAAIDPARDVTAVDGLPVVSRAAAVCQLGWDSPHLVERAVDEFSRTSSMAWLRETADRHRAAGSRGVAALDRVLNDPRRADGVTDSWFERVIERLLRHRDLPPIELQYEVVVDGHVYRIDVAIPNVLIGIEGHSQTFHWGPKVVDADNVRDIHLGSVGWRMFYVTWWQAHHPDRFVDHIVAAARFRIDNGLVA
ncbi:MAG: type IV toxin-antitoxin system AbiEi family antitoxin domain-containing protein [Acidimicrobiales bacterium]